MPIYEYQCLECQRVTEVIQKISEAPMTACPRCSGELKKLVSSSSFQLKGGGWYADGYCSSGSCSKAANGSGAAKESCGSSSSGSTACGGCAG
jgi:putative FmdB family regulatory protein